MKMLCIVLSVALLGCTRQTSHANHSETSTQIPEEARWLLTGNNDERFLRAATHFRGFDMAMVETGYRYGELHWAGVDRNWGYAEYQLRKIETALARGVERRPRRAASARVMDPVIQTVRQSIAARDGARFDAAFSLLTTTCNGCHQAEQVPFVRVVPPSVRTSIVHAPGVPTP